MEDQDQIAHGQEVSPFYTCPEEAYHTHHPMQHTYHDLTSTPYTSLDWLTQPAVWVGLDWP
jgi:hypothetical protein